MLFDIHSRNEMEAVTDIFLYCDIYQSKTVSSIHRFLVG